MTAPNVETFVRYAAECFLRAEETRDERALHAAVFAIGEDGVVDPLLSAHDKPRWPHACGSPMSVCPRCAPHLFPPPPHTGHAGDGKPYAIVSRYHRPGHEKDIVVTPFHPQDRDRTAQVGWQVRDDGDTARIVLAHWDRAATWDALVVLARELSDQGRHVALGSSVYFRAEAEDIAALDRAIATHRGDHDGPGSTIRRAHLRKFAETARGILATDPALRSVMLALGQFYSDQASDEVHARIVASERDVPVWPHSCPRETIDEPTRAQLGTERCSWCGKLARFDLDYYAAPVGLGPFCIEGASQDSEHRFSYRPYAIARRAYEGGIALEIVGPCRRKGGTAIGLVGDGVDAPPWPDVRAAELAVAPEPEARSVLADHLIECGDPRGERLAHGEPAMLNPLGRVIVAGGAHFDRGLLVGAEVYTDDAEDVGAVIGAVAWSTVQTLRYLPGSWCVLDPAMRALRELYGATADDAAGIARAEPAFALEVLQVARGEAAAVAAIPATKLPHLRHLIITEPDEAALQLLAAAAWWPQLARVTVASHHEDALRARLGVPCADSRVVRVDELGRPAGWQTRYLRDEGRVEISLANYHPHATRETLATVRARAHRLAPRVTVVASRYFVPTPEEATE